MEPVPGHYGGRIRVYESSGMTPGIWLNAAELDNANGPLDGPEHDATVLLTLADARVLRDRLAWLIDNHFLADDDAASRDALEALTPPPDRTTVFNPVTRRWEDA